MTLESMKHHISDQAYKLFIEPFSGNMPPTYSKYGRYVLIILVALGIILGIRMGYRWYDIKRNEAAQRAFSQAVAQFDKAQQAPVDMWGEVAMAFKLGYEQHSSSSLAPYFLAFQAQALLRQGHYREALDLLDSVEKQGTPTPFARLYTIQKTLIKLDQEDTDTQEQGLQELLAIAQDAKNKYRDEALYYLGFYYWSRGDLVRAKAEWQLLVQLFPAHGQAGSAYAAQAQVRLNQIA
jgi:hypothetical protein